MSDILIEPTWLATKIALKFYKKRKVIFDKYNEFIKKEAEVSIKFLHSTQMDACGTVSFSILMKLLLIQIRNHAPLHWLICVND